MGPGKNPGSGPGGGDNSILMRIARQFTGLAIIATESRSKKQASRRIHGAHHVIDHIKPGGVNIGQQRAEPASERASRESEAGEKAGWTLPNGFLNTLV